MLEKDPRTSQVYFNYRKNFLMVLLILDDVDNLKQLKFLAGEHGWFGPGSRIIITSRDQQCLNVHEVDASYEVEALNYKESIQLFCQHAFKQNIPKSDYVDLSNHVVNYVNDLPLALEVLGSFLFNKSVPDWVSALQKLKENPNTEVQNVLKISFDGLDKTEQETFLDIVCFFKGWNENDVRRLVEHGKIVIRVLSDKCFITLVGNTIRMHDLVEEMGRDIVRHEHPKVPGEWSRLWDPKDIFLVLRKKMGTEAVEAIFLDMCKSREISFTTEAFKRMERLRLFKIYWSSGFLNYMGKGCQKLLLPAKFEFPSHYLRYLHWERYPLKSLPSNFDGENLIELNLQHSNIEHLWQEEKYLEELKILNLSQSQQLNEIPHFSNMSNLEQLDVEGCRSLDNVDSSVGFLKKLTLLNLRGCQKIRSLPSTIQNLTFPENMEDMECLKSLDLSGTCIKELPSSIEFLKHLAYLRLVKCENLRSLPSSICRLKYLHNLDLFDCSNLETFPEIMEDMECLKSLDLSGTCIKELPSSIEFLKHLVDLWLVKCENLRSLPSSICRLKYLEELNLSGCSNLETFPEIMEDMECLKSLALSGTCIKELPSSIEFLKHLAYLRLVKCENLRSLPSSICRLKYLHNLDLFDCSNLETFPEIMEDMECLKSLNLSGTLKYLKELNLSGCSNLETFPEIMEDMERLEWLDLSGTCIKELPSSIGYLNHLIYLHLSHCKNLRSLPSSIGWLKLLRKLNLNDCPNLVTGDMENLINLGVLETQNMMDGVASSDLWCLSLLEVLDLSQNNMRHIPTAITRLCNLRHLNISHCKMLEEILEVPSSLREINAHDCPIFGTLSNPSTLLWSFLLKWFKTVKPPLKWKSINLGGNGIPRWVLHQEMGSQIRIELPMNCCGVHLIYSQDDQRNHISSVDFLGIQDNEDNHMPILLNLLENFGDNKSYEEKP
ncbi:TMV resistance protein N [Vitis vinifera]|uniref:TMV resistance protein N n=1 Tax=Vitis vinifera TaxID=29760 RepID=A0A438IBX6_VITVI|nr:TMV resistance protein N [Vitis vinifera]